MSRESQLTDAQVQFAADLKAECVPRIHRSTVPFYGIQDKKMVLDRTGVLYKIAGHRFVLTAAHGLRGIIKAKIPLCIDPGDGIAQPIPIVDAIYHTTEEDSRDVAVIKLSAESVDELGSKKEFLTHRDIRMGDKDPNS